MSIDELDKIKEDEMKKKKKKENYRGIYEAKASIDPKIKTKWEKQNNSNNYMGSGAVQIWNRDTTVKRE